MILNLIKFNENTFTNDDLPFLVEIIENLESTTLNVTITQETENSSISDIKNTLAKLQFHQKFPHFYIDQITKEIELISERFYEIAKSEKEKISQLGYDTVSRIISNSKLCIETEDDIFDLIIDLYSQNPEYVNLFSFVIFKNVSKEKMEEFAVRVRYEDITKEGCSRLACEVIGQTKEGGSEECPLRYKKLVQEERKATKTILYENQKFDFINPWRRWMETL